MILNIKRLFGNTEHLSKVLITVVLIVIILLGLNGFRYDVIFTYISPVQSQTLPTDGWTTLGYNIYRNSFIPITDGAGNIGTPTIKWWYTSNLNTEGHYMYGSNDLIIDIDGNGAFEVVAVDGAGRLTILDGATGNRHLLTFLYISTYSVPAALDLDNDNILELIVCTKDGYLEAIEVYQNGWTSSVIWKSERIDFYIGSSPVIYDINNDNILEVAIATRSGIYVYDSRNGNLIWSKAGVYSVLVGGLSIVGDVNTDNHLDMVFAEEYGKVYLISGKDGATLWTVNLWSNSLLNKNLIVHTPVVGDVDGDGTNEIIISIGSEVFDWISGTRSSSTSTGLKVAKTGVRGYVVILDGLTGTIEDIVQPAAGRGLFTWFSQPSISVGDYDGDNADEIFIGASDGYVYKIDYQAGQYQLTELIQADTYWATTFGADASIIAMSTVLCDIDGDSSYELLIYSTNRVAGTPGYTLYSVNPSNGNIEWSIDFDYSDVGLSEAEDAKITWPSISVWDIDGDGNLEIIINAFQAVVAIDG